MHNRRNTRAQLSPSGTRTTRRPPRRVKRVLARAWVNTCFGTTGVREISKATMHADLVLRIDPFLEGTSLSAQFRGGTFARKTRRGAVLRDRGLEMTWPKRLCHVSDSLQNVPHKGRTLAKRTPRGRAHVFARATHLSLELTWPQCLRDVSDWTQHVPHKGRPLSTRASGESIVALADG